MNTLLSISSRRCTISRRLLLLVSLLYLLLPNILFLLGWFRLVYALPLSVALLISVGWIFYGACREDVSCARCLFTGGDALKLLGTCLLVLLFVELIGYTGHVSQSVDFMVRNPIYHTLVRDAWPIFSARGEYFIYYHSFWLPAALISKCLGAAVSPDVILYLWVLLGLLLFIFLMFTRIRGKVLTLFVILCLLGNATELPKLLLYLPPFPGHDLCVKALSYSGFGTTMRYTHFWVSVAYAFNSAVPALVCGGLFLSKILPRRYFPIAAALIASSSPFCTLALFPLMLILILRDVSILRKMLSDIKVWFCVMLLVACGMYFMGQEASETRFIWSDSENLLNLPEAFRLPIVRMLRYIYITLGCLIPAFLLIRRRLRRNVWFHTLFALVFILPFVWIGRHNNEFLLKGSIYLFVIYAWLLTEELRYAGQRKRIALVLFLLASSLHLGADAMSRHWADYSWKPEKIAEHIESSWHDTLNNPDDYCYKQFWGKVLCPAIQYSVPGESPVK